jgi:hypothetical protein
MRKLKDNKDASVVPLILFVLTILGCGALYSLLFLEIALPSLSHMIPDSDSKTFILMGIYATPLFILVIGVLAFLQAGLKRGFYTGGM